MFLGIDKESLEVQKGLYTAKEINQQPRVWIESMNRMKLKKDEIIKFNRGFYLKLI